MVRKTEGRGRFITIEGVEGAGKSTAIRLVRLMLEEHGIEFVISREPGGTEIGEAVRDVLLAHYQDAMCAETELLLFFAGRKQHVEELIKPALDAGQWVLLDRFTDASYAYQGGGRGVPNKRIEKLEGWLLGDLRPDLTLLLDLPTDVGLQRIKGRSKLDRIEIEQADFFERIRDAYLAQAKKEPKRFRVINASRGLKQVEEDLRAAIDGLLP